MIQMQTLPTCFSSRAIACMFFTFENRVPLMRYVWYLSLQLMKT